MVLASLQPLQLSGREIPGADETAFDKAAQAAKTGVPVSKLLKAEVTMDAVGESATCCNSTNRRINSERNALAIALAPFAVW